MAALKWAIIAGLIAAPGQASAAPLDHWAKEIREASRRFGIPQSWIRAVMKAESGGQLTIKGRPITSAAGAMGLMQLMPGTWADMRQAYALGSDPYDPRDNVLAGAAYLRAMYDRFGYPGLFAAYNAGPKRYSAKLMGHRPLPLETRAYVASVVGGEAGGARAAEGGLESRARHLALHVKKPRLEPTEVHASLFAIR
jgi:soluble lytic murein transglycosylase-like protein